VAVIWTYFRKPHGLNPGRAVDFSCVYSVEFEILYSERPRLNSYFVVFVFIFSSDSAVRDLSFTKLVMYPSSTAVRGVGEKSNSLLQQDFVGCFSLSMYS
jgi:hypothetical protein